MLDGESHNDAEQDRQSTNSRQDGHIMVSRGHLGRPGAVRLRTDRAHIVKACSSSTTACIGPSAITVEPNLNRANGGAQFERPPPRRGSSINGQLARCALRVALRFSERILNLGDCFLGLIIINR